MRLLTSPMWRGGRDARTRERADRLSARSTGAGQHNHQFGRGQSSMFEQDKLDEAQYFLGHLRGLREPRHFQYELSAFLTAARTALQYALDEARTKPGGQHWYDTQVSAKAVIKFV